MESYIAPSLFLNHGGGPSPVLGEKNNIQMANALRNVPNLLDFSKLNAIILVTAHRQEDVVTISSGKRHDLLYDYYNFPPESYELKYDAPGDPELAGRLHSAFKNANIPSKLDEKRGWDHGVFIPMLLINPSANIPIVQVSILKNQDAVDHYNIGKILYEFRREGIAIFGSGLSYHNMKEFKKLRASSDAMDGIVVNEVFDQFLNDVCTGKLEAEAILTWDTIPQGRESHPLGDADHLMPLIVNLGAAGPKPGRNIFSSIFLQKFKLSGFIWD
ncbi:dioxygenase tasH-like [Colias croceus]|uniref:dioxygenase tasH-like n=1 Tax=Colias crocea TaxID=72248 RepID=UPI001E27BBF0|nr:dioxygenase tasH-like [Colias croceus]